jgi:hypothetical protein
MCLFFYFRKQKFIIVAVHVDDMTTLTNSTDLRDELLGPLKEKIALNLLGPAQWILQTEIVRDFSNLTVAVSQKQYVLSIVEKYNLGHCNSVDTPITKQNLDALLIDKRVYPDQKQYQEATGSLNYLACITRMDISYAVSKASSFNSKPTVAAWDLVKRIIRYIKGTANYALTFRYNGNSDIIGFVDSDWATDADTRKSTTGYVFLLSDAAVAWQSKRQQAVAQSSTEAEFMALGIASSEAMFLRNITTEIFQRIFSKTRMPIQLFGFRGIEEIKNELRREEIKREEDSREKAIQVNERAMVREPTTIRQDNQGSIAIATNNSGTKRIKHIDIKYMFVKDLTKANLLKIDYLPTNKMPADFLTKPVNSDVHKRCSFECGLVTLLREDIGGKEKSNEADKEYGEQKRGISVQEQKRGMKVQEQKRDYRTSVPAHENKH